MHVEPAFLNELLSACHIVQERKQMHTEQGNFLAVCVFAHGPVVLHATKQCAPHFCQCRAT